MEPSPGWEPLLQFCWCSRLVWFFCLIIANIRRKPCRLSLFLNCQPHFLLSLTSINSVLHCHVLTATSHCDCAAVVAVASHTTHLLLLLYSSVLTSWELPWALSALLWVIWLPGKQLFFALVDTPLFELCPDLDVKASHPLQALVLLDTNRHGWDSVYHPWLKVFFSGLFAFTGGDISSSFLPPPITVVNSLIKLWTS